MLHNLYFQPKNLRKKKWPPVFACHFTPSGYCCYYTRF